MVILENQGSCVDMQWQFTFWTYEILCVWCRPL